MNTRKEVAGVDKFNFEHWVERFVTDIVDKNTKGRKVPVMYDIYRSHLGDNVLEILKAGNAIA